MIRWRIEIGMATVTVEVDASDADEAGAKAKELLWNSYVLRAALRCRRACRVEGQS